MRFHSVACNTNGGIPVRATDYLAIAAFLVSLTSLGFSIYFGFLDRSRLKASSVYYPEWEHSSAHITVSAVNHGRRPIILTLFGGYYEDGSWEGTQLGGKDGKGLRLAENERFEQTIRSDHDKALQYSNPVANHRSLVSGYVGEAVQS